MHSITLTISIRFISGKDECTEIKRKIYIYKSRTSFFIMTTNPIRLPFVQVLGQCLPPLDFHLGHIDRSHHHHVSALLHVLIQSNEPIAYVYCDSLTCLVQQTAHKDWVPGRITTTTWRRLWLAFVIETLIPCWSYRAACMAWWMWMDPLVWRCKSMDFMLFVVNVIIMKSFMYIETYLIQNYRMLSILLEKNYRE